MPVVQVGEIEAFRDKIASRALTGAILNPLPKAQTQEGPNCGFYALSIVMHYWKAKGKTLIALPARKRDVPGPTGSGEAVRSLREVGKSAGALDMGGVEKVSTGGVFTAHQLAEVAKAVEFKARVFTLDQPQAFIEGLCKLVEAGVPPIVAFDVKDSEPATNLGGAHSHWGVIIGHYTQDGCLRLLATHGHGKYYVWVARDLQESNFALRKTTRMIPDEVKVRVVLKKEAIADDRFAPLTRWHWANATTLKRYKEFAASADSRVAKVELKDKEIRRGMGVEQNLGSHIVAVVPK